MDEAVDGKVPLTNIADQVYDLYGVVVHQGGSTSSGHYYSYCKTDMALNQTEKPGNGKWYECNDSYISPISEQQALNAQAYLLFYQKRVTMPSLK
jgi:ubiquitin carboxyl-terminal hydrolase 36/42